MNKEKEIETVTLMVHRYCLGVHGTRCRALCLVCNALLEYARERRDRCLHGKI
ncbi:MAG: nitrous oxide-stimulated promoter family protein [Oscillospiraceae bacterium]